MYKLSSMNDLLLSKEQEGWDEYWLNQANHRRRLYDSIASFYRTHIIKRSLNGFVLKYFPDSSELLHAGCGAGQVDVDLVKKMKITALDISLPALERYRALHGELARTARGSILELPFQKESFDGVYNLGVMEHFFEKDIHVILHEFHRVLKPQGKIVLFWPPEYGLSVAAFKVIHFFCNTLLKKNIELCPTEFTHLHSKKHALRLLENSGFKLLEYSFGSGDAFTHAIVIGQKA